MAYEPSQIGLALLDGICDATSKDDARQLVKETREVVQKAIDDVVERFGNRSLYVMQIMSEIMQATVLTTLETMAKNHTLQ